MAEIIRISEEPIIYIADNPAELLIDYINRFMVMTRPQLLTVSLWLIHTHAIGAANFSPYLNPKSAQRQSGKTTLFDISKCLCLNPLDTTHISAAGLRRAFTEPRTLLWDEVDEVFKKRDEDTAEIKSVLNAGFKRGQKVQLLEKGKGATWHLVEVPVFSAKFLSGIGGLPDTINSRSIPIGLTRMSSSEIRERFVESEQEAYTSALRELISQWAQANLTILKDARPTAPPSLNGRQVDIWQPLFAIADVLGMGPEARSAALTLHDSPVTDSKEVALLRALRNIFYASEQKEIFSADLCRQLNDDDHAQWRYMGKEGIDPFQMSLILKEFGIQPHPFRRGVQQLRGYSLSDFSETWERYL